MFGHQDDKSSKQDTDAIPENSINGVLSEPGNEALVAEDRSSGQPAEQPTVAEPASIVASGPVDETPDPAASPANDPPFQHPGTPPAADQDQIKDIISPAGGFPQGPNFQPPVSTHSPLVSPISQDDTTNAADSELIDIRQKALVDLAPIIDQLDLPPEEKFHTIMMIIQVSDDQAMVKAAYKAAHSIEDEKARAKALLDIINEVNYFTHTPEA